MISFPTWAVGVLWVFLGEQRKQQVRHRTIMQREKNCFSKCYRSEAVDSSEWCKKQSEKNALMNQFSKRFEAIQSDVEAYLEHLYSKIKHEEEKEEDLKHRKKNTRTSRYGVVVCDPPSLLRGGSDKRGALTKYTQLNAKAMRVLEPGGVLLSCSCSAALSAEEFVMVLNRAAVLANRKDVRIVGRGSLPPDHPIALSSPPLSQEYLKCFALIVG